MLMLVIGPSHQRKRASSFDRLRMKPSKVSASPPIASWWACRTMKPSSSPLDEQLARHVGQGLASALGYHDGLGDLQAPVVEPQAGHEVEGHAGLQHRGV